MLSLRSPLLPLCDSWNAITTDLQNLIRRIRDPYRPELHYMRGPGPKWHAKHAVQAATAG